MAIEKTKGGRFRAKVKQGRTQVMSKTFPTRREAQAWHDRQRALLDGGYDPRAGKASMRKVLQEWADGRCGRVAEKTAAVDAALLRLLSPSLANLSVGALRPRNVVAWFDWLHANGQSRSSIVRYRASLSAALAWMVDEGIASANPVLSARVPRYLEPPAAEMKPFTEAELEQVYESCRALDSGLAAIVLIAGWTGLRWGELRAMRVEGLRCGETPGLLVSRSQTEGGTEKPPKSYATRWVPLASRVLPLVERWAEGKDGDELLFTGARGGQLWRGSFVRTLNWATTGRGRRIHDLRHSAACLWLARGVDVGTVQGWMGHESIATTNRYLHHLGSSADRAGLELLNRSGGSVGGPITGEEAR